MTSGQPKRKRGVVLTPSGRQKLQGAIKVGEEQDNFGEKLTIEELSAHTKLDAGTVSKVLDCEEGVDRRTLERFFQAFNLDLTQDDYSKPNPSVERRPTKNTRIDWGEAVDVSIFYGRTVELETLERWIVSDCCRLIALLGMGGIGKTSLAAKLGEQVQSEFDYAVWQSLREAPPLKEILTSLIQFLSNQQETEADLPETLGGRVTKLLEYLRTQRCLIILDNAESILQEGQAGVYREGYEGYGELLRRVGESSHRSCLLVTSREKPRELSAMEGEAFLVRSLQLRGVEGAEGQEILKAKGLNLSERSEGAELVHRCAGNPLALKLVATTIQDLFDGDIGEFLNQETIAFEGVRDLLDQHFDRLSDLEKSVMYWLAINREPVLLQELQKDIVPPVTKSRLLEALKGLVGRSLIEKSANNFTQQPVVMEYVTEQLIERVFEEIQTKKPSLFNSHALLKATSKDHVRDVQIRLVLNPIASRFMSSIAKEKYFEIQLEQLLLHVKESSLQQLGYVCGNVLNFLCYIKSNLTNYDFSHMAIRQAYLRGINLHQVNLAYSNISQTIFTHTFGSVFSIAFSPNGKFLATSDATREIHLWNALDTQQIFTLKGHTDVVRSVAFSPDNQTLASGCFDHTIRLWNVKTGQCLKILSEHTDSVRSVAFSPNGEVLASGSSDHTVRLWNIRTGQCLKVLEAHCDRIHSIAFSPDGQVLATGSSDHTAKLWNLRTGECLNVLSGHHGYVMSVAFSPDGQFLATGGYDHMIKLWSTHTSQCLRTLDEHTSYLRTITFSPDSSTLASAGDDHTIKLWSVSTGQCLRTLQAHSKAVHSLIFSPDGQILASASEDHTIKLWDADTFDCLKTLQGYTNWLGSLAFNAEGQVLASNNEDHSIMLWDMQTGQCFQNLPGHANWVTAIAFHPNGQALVSGSADRTIKIWNISTNQCVYTLVGHTDWIESIAFSPSGKTLVSGSSDDTMRLWDVNTGKCLQVLQEHTNTVQTVAFDSNSHLLASGSSDHTIKLWNVDGECLKTLREHTNAVRSVAFSPKGNILASGSSDHTIKLWDINTGRCIKTLYGHSNSVASIAFSPDGQTLISLSKDRSIRLWDINAGEPLNIFQNYPQNVHSAIFSPNGRLIASGHDGAINLWNFQTDGCIQTLSVPKPYEGMNIHGVIGLTEVQKASLIALGAVESE